MAKRQTRPRSRNNTAPGGQVRIIAGRWRGRRLPVPGAEGLRPTGDRVRETLFNWLGPYIEGAHCLDLFAGTGALGIEALSRGAAAAWFIERDAIVAGKLRESLQRLGCTAGRVVIADALALLSQPPQRFDIVFLDPPFGGPDHGNLCRLLGAGWLNEGAVVYLEMSRSEPLPALPEGWEALRASTAGRVRFALLRYYAVK
jgi:16S rRNA (guanine966-N2)-methyltransferase